MAKPLEERNLFHFLFRSITFCPGNGVNSVHFIFSQHLPHVSIPAFCTFRLQEQECLEQRILNQISERCLLGPSKAYRPHQYALEPSRERANDSLHRLKTNQLRVHRRLDNTSLSPAYRKIEPYERTVHNLSLHAIPKNPTRTQCYAMSREYCRRELSKEWFYSYSLYRYLTRPYSHSLL